MSFAEEEVNFAAMKQTFGESPENKHWTLRPTYRTHWIVHKKVNDEPVGECFRREEGTIVCLYRGQEGVVGDSPLEAVYNAWKIYTETPRGS